MQAWQVGYNLIPSTIIAQTIKKVIVFKEMKMMKLILLK